MHATVLSYEERRNQALTAFETCRMAGTIVANASNSQADYHRIEKEEMRIEKEEMQMQLEEMKSKLEQLTLEQSQILSLH